VQKIIRAKGLVDVEQGRLIPDPCLVIEGDKIAALGDHKAMPSLELGAEIFDFGDQYILPGLINSHAHPFMNSDGRPIMAFMQEDYEVWVLAAAKNVRTELMSGVTTIRDCGSPKGVMFGLRKAIEMGFTDGPRLFLSGQPLTMTGGHCDYFAHEVDGPQGMIEAVRLRCKEGADFIKIMATGGGTPGTYPCYASYAVEEIAAAVETAHRIEKRVGAHCRGTLGIRNAIEGGIDQIEHACFEQPDGSLKFDRRLADQMAEKNIYVTPTIQLYRDLLSAYTRKKEEGTLYYTVNRDRTDPNLVVVIEKYKDDAAFQAHSTTPYLAELFGKAQPLIEGDMELSMMDEIGSI